VSEKHTVLLVATILADLIVVVGFSVFVFFAVRALNAKVAKTPVPEAPDSSLPVLYIAAVLVWPAALALGMARLGKPETVRSGRVMLLIAIGHFTLAVVLAVALVTVGAVYAPPELVNLLP